VANEVYANGMELACKAGQGKSICAFPDVCMTPPENPATPPGVPIPYPNTGMASDTTDGSKSVQISGKEVMLKNKSYFKKSTGDEAGSAAKKGVITSVNTGKVYFNAWSMDVKFEGENVVRNLDLTTHNHASVPGNSPTWPFIDKMDVATASTCQKEIEKEHNACSKLEVKSKNGKVQAGATKAKRCADTDDAKACREAQKCMMRPWRPNQCCPGEQGHHLVEVHCFAPAGGRKIGEMLPEFKGGYDEKKAPVVCALGPRSDREHGALHAVQQQLEAAHHQKNSGWNYKEARDAGLKAHSLVYPDCDPQCTQTQLDAYHNQPKPNGPGCDEKTALRTDPQAGTRSRGLLTPVQQDEITSATNAIRGVTSMPVV
jgi:hypothetical protein